MCTHCVAHTTMCLYQLAEYTITLCCWEEVRRFYERPPRHREAALSSDYNEDSMNVVLKVIDKTTLK